MKRMHFFILLAAIVVTQSCEQQASSTMSAANASSSATVKGQSAVRDDDSQKNILQIAIGSQDHTTLTKAVQAAQLEDVLSNAGPLTVFAPNNAAFAKLPAGTVDNLLKPESKSTLARIIKHHASPGSFKAEDLKNNQQLYQATGQYIKVERKDDGVYVGGAKILGTVQASNGIVHIVDSVILPAEN
jgi:uncharacterized surface protein with fasciclin (FAS1) repeats